MDATFILIVQSYYKNISLYLQCHLREQKLAQHLFFWLESIISRRFRLDRAINFFAEINILTWHVI